MSTITPVADIFGSLGTQPPLYGAYSAAQLTAGQSISLSVGGSQKFDGSMPFSIGIWMRVTIANGAGTILSRPNAFTLSLQENSLVTFQFAGSSSITTGWGLNQGAWHYLLVDYMPDDGTSQGTLTLYIDNAPAEAQPISWSGNDSMQPLTIGGQNDFAADVMSVAIWSAALPLVEAANEWAVPGTFNLIAAFDFANGVAQDVSDNNWPLTFLGGATQAWFLPSLSFPGPGSGSYVQPGANDTLMPASGAAPFTIQFCAIPPRPKVNAPGVNVSVVDMNSAAFFYFETYYWGTGGGLLSVGKAVFGNSIVAPENIYTPLGANVAIAYDGSAVTLYYEGQEVATQVVGALPQISQPKLTIGAIANSAVSGGFSGFYTGNIQSVTVWNACLSAQDVQTYVTADPTVDPRCVAYLYFGMPQPANLISGEPVQVTGQVVADEFSWPVTAETGIASSVRPSTLVPTRPLRGDSMQALAVQLGSDPNIRPQTELLNDSDFDAIIAWYEHLLSSAPESQRPRLKRLFTRNLYSGFHVYERSGRRPLPGMVVLTSQGDDHVFHYHTASGAQEILRLPAAAVDPCTAWGIAMLIQMLQCVLDVFMIGFALDKLGKAVGNAVEKSPTVLEFLQGVKRENPTGGAFIQACKSLWGSGQLGTVIVQGLSGGSFWSWAFTAASAVISIASVWLTGPLYLGAMIAVLVSDFAKLGFLFGRRPAGCLE